MSSALRFATRPAVGHVRDIVARDKARVSKLLKETKPHGPLYIRELRRARHSHHHGRQEDDSPSGVGVDATDASVTYTASVGVGNPATQYTLLIDTGSSNTWIGAGKPYVKTSTSKNTGARVQVSYGSGSFSGTEYIDRVELGPQLVIDQQSIGVASHATQDFNGVDGLLGVGPVDLTQKTLSTGKEIPTVTDNLFANGTIQNDTLGISYEPTTENGQVNGELTFGGVDQSKITGEINYVPITSTSPANKYWGIDQTLSYGTSEILGQSAGIVDTGTTLTMIASDAFQKYVELTGAKPDEESGLLTISASQFQNLKSLNFNIGGNTYELTANAQIFPRALSDVLGLDKSKIYLIVADMGSVSGLGLDFINGYTFLQRFYSVYDTGNSRVGLATTPFTNAETN